MRYLIDTDWVIDHLNGVEKIVAKLQELAPQGLALSIVSLAELYEGIYSSPNPAENEIALKKFLDGVAILEISEEICKTFARKREKLRKKGELIRKNRIALQEIMSNAQKRKDIVKILRRYKSLLKEDKFPVKEMILYGSYAKGNFRSYSDIDVCIVSDKFSKNKDGYETYLWKKVLEVDPRIEPVGYYPAEFKDIDPLVDEIKKNGIVIK